MNEPLVSVIIPAYNAEQYIEEAINSVLAQTYQNWELLVADDGSTDETKKVVQSYCLKDPRIKYLYQPNGRLPKARNLGLENAQGEYVAFLDADDVWFKDKLSVQVKLFDETRADLIFSDGVIFSDNIDQATMVLNSGKGYFSGMEGLKTFLIYNRIPVLSVVMKRSAINEVDGFCEDASIPKSEDYHLWLRLLMQGYVLFGSDKVLCGYREHHAAMSSSDKLCTSAVVEVLRDLKQKFPGYHGILNTAMKTWFARYQHIAYNQDYAKVIKKNCEYVEKKQFNFLFQSVYFFCGFNITMRLMNKFVNG